MALGTHDFTPDPRNDAILIYVNGTLASRAQAVVSVFDSDILNDPAGMLHALCAALGITWDDAMLGWQAGPHPDDGIWGRHWYCAVETSTRFAPSPTNMPKLSDAARRIADECQADYARLAALRIKTAAQDKAIPVDPAAWLR